MNNSGKIQKRHIGVLDVCILVALVAIIAGVAARFILRDNSSMAQPKALQNYLVDFEIKDIRGTSEKYLKTDSPFYLDETGDYLGVVYKKRSAVRSCDDGICHTGGECCVRTESA